MCLYRWRKTIFYFNFRDDDVIMIWPLLLIMEWRPSELFIKVTLSHLIDISFSRIVFISFIFIEIFCNFPYCRWKISSRSMEYQLNQNTHGPLHKNRCPLIVQKHSVLSAAHKPLVLHRVSGLQWTNESKYMLMLLLLLRTINTDIYSVPKKNLSI